MQEENKMTIVNVNGVNLNYESAGQGETVVFLHGYTGSTKDWASQIKALSSKYRVIAIDGRGHGKSAAPAREEDYSIQIFGRDVSSLLKSLNIKKCCLVGHSYGGFTALQYALEHRDRLVALVLVDTSSEAMVKDAGYAQLRQKVDELASSSGLEAAFEYDATHNPMRVERFKKHPEQKEIARQKVLNTSVNGYIYTSRAIDKRSILTNRLSEIKVPTLIYWGDEDTAFNTAVQVLNQGIAGSELVTIKGVGHSPHEEAPDIFNKALLKFLEQIKW